VSTLWGKVAAGGKGMTVYAELRAILDASDKRRTHWRWVMPRDQWEMFRDEVGDKGEPLVKASAAWPHGTMLGYPIVLDERVEHVVLEKGEP